MFDGASPLREKAKRILIILSAGTPLDTFLKTLPARSVGRRLEATDESEKEALLHGYAGPEACLSCHRNQYTAWQQTGMARMLQSYRRENVIGDFASSNYAERTGNEDEPDVVRFGWKDRPYFEIRSGPNWNRYYVDFTIGSKWQQAYATKLSDGRMQVLPIEYNALQKRWINYWRLIDPPGGARANIHEFPKLTSATNYQQNCAICHTSQLKEDGKASLERATFLQAGIDCEMCHGPSEWHIKQVRRGLVGHQDPVQPPIDFKHVSNREGVRVCAQCHRQSAVRVLGEGGEMNYSTKGSFIPATWIRPYDAFSRKAFYKDGRFRETTFIVEAFTRSACYRRGTAQCATCHSPHLGDFDRNQTALKFSGEPNKLCLGCHSEYTNRVAEHSRHRAHSEASQCVTCHMPRIVNALLFQARSHQIEIPSADLTQRFGQQESPNVCLGCHSTKDAVWAKEQLAAWRH